MSAALDKDGAFGAVHSALRTVHERIGVTACRVASLVESLDVDGVGIVKRYIGEDGRSGEISVVRMCEGETGVR